MCAVVVYHGGAGITHTGLAAGVPTIVVSHGVDQIYLAKALYKLGVSPRLLNRKTVTENNLAAAITQALASEAMRKQAQKHTNRMKQEIGVEKAILLLEKYYT